MNTRSLEITPDILRLISDIDDFRASWRTMKNLVPERLATLKRVATIESIGSSTRIEGSKLSDVEIENVLGNLSTQSFANRDEQEVAGYAEVMDVIFQSYQEIELSENYIKQLHSMLLKHSDKDQRHRGEYKSLTNHVEAFDSEGNSLGVVFQTVLIGVRVDKNQKPGPDLSRFCMCLNWLIRLCDGVSFCFFFC